ncbi:MAG: teicoplanin resistance protein VanZ [Proteobacteria bacterium]|nr:MAG: teicoplanin resistance protein VanZ [Pseudomonadota bacterium]
MKNLAKISFFTCIIIIEYLATTSNHMKLMENTWDKSNHLLAFFALYILFAFAFEKCLSKCKILALLTFGIQIECVQYFLPYRDFSFLDIFADGVGIFLGFLAIFPLKKIF